jgi:hypothetical protein
MTRLDAPPGQSFAGGWLAAAALALAQTCCLWLWLSVLGHGLSGADGQFLADLPAAALFLNALLACALPVITQRRGWPAQRLAAVHFAAAVGTIGLTITLTLLRGGGTSALGTRVGQESGSLALVAVGLGVLWWRGAALAADEFVYDAVLWEWRAWTVALVLPLLFGASTLALTGGTGPAVGLFLLGGLVAIAAAWRQAPAGRARPRAFAASSSWWATLAFTTLAVFAPALLGAALAGPSFTAAVLGALGRLVDLVFFLLTPLFLALGWLAALLVEALRALEHRAGVKQRTPSSPAARVAFSHGAQQPAHIPPWALWTGFALLSILVLTIFFVLLRRTAARSAASLADEAAREERESLLSWGDAWRSALSWLRRLVSGSRHAASSHPTAAGGDAPLPMATATVRDVYRAFLALGASLDTPRTPAETPHEYLARLRPRLARWEKDVSVITALYVQARYGPSPSTDQQAERARSAWEHLTASL